jgi:hypothetical protein
MLALWAKSLRGLKYRIHWSGQMNFCAKWPRHYLRSGRHLFPTVINFWLLVGADRYQ